jgi:hypothetical protein
MVITPLKHSADKKCNFGATITGLDLNVISDEDLMTLKDAIYKYQLVVIKGQHNLDPVKHWELITRLDPTAPQVHGHGTVKEFQKSGGMLAVRTPPCPPLLFFSLVVCLFIVFFTMSGILIRIRNEWCMAYQQRPMCDSSARAIRAMITMVSKASLPSEPAMIITSTHQALRHLQQVTPSSKDGTWMLLCTIVSRHTSQLSVQ